MELGNHFEAMPRMRGGYQMDRLVQVAEESERKPSRSPQTSGPSHGVSHSMCASLVHPTGCGYLRTLLGHSLYWPSFTLTIRSFITRPPIWNVLKKVSSHLILVRPHLKPTWRKKGERKEVGWEGRMLRTLFYIELKPRHQYLRLLLHFISSHGFDRVPQGLLSLVSSPFSSLHLIGCVEQRTSLLLYGQKSGIWRAYWWRKESLQAKEYVWRF